MLFSSLPCTFEHTPQFNLIKCIISSPRIGDHNTTNSCHNHSTQYGFGIAPDHTLPICCRNAMSASSLEHSVPLLLFAKARELAGTARSEIVRPIPSQVRCDALLHHICQQHNLLAIQKHVILAINGEYCALDDVVDWSTVTEVAVIPPISGG